MSRRVSVSLPPELAKLVGRESERRGQTVSAFVRDAIDAFLVMRGVDARRFSFIGIGRSGQKRTARRAGELLAREWSRARGG